MAFLKCCFHTKKNSMKIKTKIMNCNGSSKAFTQKCRKECLNHFLCRMARIIACFGASELGPQRPKGCTVYLLKLRLVCGYTFYVSSSVSFITETCTVKPSVHKTFNYE